MLNLWNYQDIETMAGCLVIFMGFTVVFFRCGDSVVVIVWSLYLLETYPVLFMDKLPGFDREFIPHSGGTLMNLGDEVCYTGLSSFLYL